MRHRLCTVILSGVAAQTVEGLSLLQDTALLLAIPPHHLLDKADLLVVPHAVAILERMLQLVADAFRLVPSLTVTDCVLSGVAAQTVEGLSLIQDTALLELS